MEQADYIGYTSKTITICQNEHVAFFRYLFTKDSFKIKKDLKILFPLSYYINFITRLSLLPKLFSEIYFFFHNYAVDKILELEHIKQEKTF